MIYSVHQPHYLPYPGYLAKVAASDVFVTLENVQYVRREWQNRNRIKGPNGAQWLTIPVNAEYKALISDVLLDNSKNWQRSHVETLRRFYAKAPFIEELDAFEEILARPHTSLADCTIDTTFFFLHCFGIETEPHKQAEYESLPEDPNLRIIEIGKRLGASTYLAGMGGKNYMNLDLFRENGIDVRFFQPEVKQYPQLHGEFIPHLGTIDLLLNTGPEGFNTYFAPTSDSIVEVSSGNE